MAETNRYETAERFKFETNIVAVLEPIVPDNVAVVAVALVPVPLKLTVTGEPIGTFVA